MIIAHSESVGMAAGPGGTTTRAGPVTTITASAIGPAPKALQLQQHDSSKEDGVGRKILHVEDECLASIAIWAVSRGLSLLEPQRLGAMGVRTTRRTFPCPCQL